MTYHTVFEASNTGMSLWVYVLAIAGGVLLLGVAAVLEWWSRRLGQTGIALLPLVLIFGLVGLGAIGIPATILSAQYSEQQQARQALKNGGCSIVEGVVTDFVPMPPGGHSTESFTMSGRHFRYPGGWGSVPFNSEYNHGYIHNGVHARLCFVDDKIYRVEVQ